MEKQSFEDQMIQILTQNNKINEMIIVPGLDAPGNDKEKITLTSLKNAIIYCSMNLDENHIMTYVDDWKQGFVKPLEGRRNYKKMNGKLKYTTIFKSNKFDLQGNDKMEVNLATYDEAKTFVSNYLDYHGALIYIPARKKGYIKNSLFCKWNVKKKSGKGEECITLIHTKEPVLEQTQVTDKTSSK